jgi:hypothetical protein
MDWIHLAQDREQSRALVNKALNLWVGYNVGKFSERLATPQEAPSSMELVSSGNLYFALFFSSGRYDVVIGLWWSPQS